MAKRMCSVADCEDPHFGRGLCSKHYQRLRRTGSLELVAVSPEARFLRRVARSEGCWLWTGFRDELGYGRFWLGGRNVMAHRFSYEMHVGPIPEGLHLDHLCRNPQCVNPAHLEPVTPVENMRRGVSPAALNRLKTICKRGHELVPENVYITSKGFRQCIKCKRMLNRAWMRDHYRSAL